MKKLISVLLALVLMLTFTFMITSLSASAADYGCNVNASSSVVYMENLDENIVVYEKNAGEKMYPASLTKIMTYIVVTESITDLENTKITIKEDAFDGLDPESSVMGLQGYIGEEFSVIDLLYGMMVPSGNDAAWVLADYVGDGYVDNFVDLMNRKAAQLGCNDTHFVNPHGLFDSMHYSTAYDLAVIAKYALEKPYYTEITGTRQYVVDGMTEVLKTTNYMIEPSKTMYYYSYVEGGKTGYTDEAGKCLITTASNDAYRYLCIALGSPYSYAEDINYAMLDTKDMYEWAFDNISNVELLPAGEVIKSYPVEFVWGDKTVDAVAQEPVTALLPKGYDTQLVTTTYDLEEKVSAPVTKGEVFGKISVYYDEDLVGTVNVVSAEDIERDQSNYLIHRFIGFVVNNIIWIVIVLCVLIVFVFMYISSRKRKKKRNARYRYR